MANAARITASFLLALSVSVGPLVVAVLLPWLEEVAAFYSSFALMLFLPIMAVSGLAWLPVMLAARDRGFDGKLGAVTMSPLAAAAFYALYITYHGFGHDLGKPTAWGAMIVFAPMMIVFSSAFFYVDQRWGQTEGGPVSTRVIAALTLLLTAWVLGALIVKERDDLISATRVGLMMLRQASSPDDALTAPHTADNDYDPLAGAPLGGRVGATREDVAWGPLR